MDENDNADILLIPSPVFDVGAAQKQKKNFNNKQLYIFISWIPSFGRNAGTNNGRRLFSVSSPSPSCPLNIFQQKLG